MVPPQNGRRYEAVLFDFDGVLADTEPVHYACWAEVVAPFGIDLDWSSYARNCIGVSDRAMIQALCDLAPHPVDFDKVWAEYPRKKQMFRERTRERSPVAAPARALVRELRGDGYRLAVVSSSGRVEVEPLLRGAEVLDLLDLVVCGEDVTALKPSPEPYLTAARRLGVSRALVVEDSDAGCASGQSAGFDVLRVPSASDTPRLVRDRLISNLG